METLRQCFDQTNETARERRPTVTIIGSLRFKDKIDEVIDLLQTSGIEVVAPRKATVAGEIHGFRFLNGDRVESFRDAVEIEDRFTEAMLNSDAVYLVNPGSYNGILSSYELGIAIAHRVPICAMEPLDWGEENHPAFKRVVKMIKVLPPNEFSQYAREAMKRNKREPVSYHTDPDEVERHLQRLVELTQKSQEAY